MTQKQSFSHLYRPRSRYFELDCSCLATLNQTSKIVFDSQELADTEEKGDQSTRSKRDEKKPPSDANDAGSDGLSLRSDGCAMGCVATLDPCDCSRCRLSGA